MNILKNVTMLALVALIISGCATVNFYSDQSLKTETGLRFYSAKPYLLVEHKTSNDTSSRIIYLPDLANPQYAKIKSGLGTSDLKMTLNNSILTEYGLKTDTKVPETIDSGIGLLSKVAEIATLGRADIVELKAAYKFELYEIIMDKNGTKLVKVTE